MATPPAPLTSTKPPQRSGKEPGTRGTSGSPARSQATVMPKPQNRDPLHDLPATPNQRPVSVNHRVKEVGIEDCPAFGFRDLGSFRVI